MADSQGFGLDRDLGLGLQVLAWRSEPRIRVSGLRLRGLVQNQGLELFSGAWPGRETKTRKPLINPNIVNPEDFENRFALEG